MSNAQSGPINERTSPKRSGHSAVKEECPDQANTVPTTKGLTGDAADGRQAPSPSVLARGVSKSRAVVRGQADRSSVKVQAKDVCRALRRAPLRRRGRGSFGALCEQCDGAQSITTHPRLFRIHVSAHHRKEPGDWARSSRFARYVSEKTGGVP